MVFGCPRVSPEWELGTLHALMKPKPETRGAVEHRDGEQPWPAGADAIPRGEMPMLSRRQLLRTAGAGAAALLLTPLGCRAEPKEEKAKEEKKDAGFTLPKLPYAFDALEPHIDARTMEIHHDKHHAAYVNNLNTALKDHPELLKKDVKDLVRDLNSLPKAVQTAVRNNGGGHLNHSMFWEMMGPKAGGKPGGELAKAIDQDLGGFEKFQAEMADKAAKRFGSGWAWLVVNKGKLEVVNTPNQDSPVTDGSEPILGIDVWEHAYYLKYRNKRPDYVKAWWNVVNWDNVASRFKAARG